ncbi:Golgin sub A member 4 [Bulinus truncatus]|nr:Golgin sub A member 4 [Bulinus truncatus]
MFKNLKKKLEQGVAQSKAAVSGLAAAAKGDEKSASTESIGKPVAESTPQKNGNNTDRLGKTSEPGYNVAVGQLVDIPLFETADSTSYETASDMSSLQGNETPKGGRSRTSSISSMTSDSSFFPNVSFSHSYYMPSDVESEMEETSVNLSSVSKEDLYAFVKRFERRAFKYKSKFMELAVAYKDMLQEREKLKSTMAQCQDRAFRRMSELREQIQLDQLAKRDLEENYRLLLDEKDEYMKVLNMQIKLLKEGKEIPENLQTKLTISQAKAEAPPPSSGREINTNISQNEEIELLKSKIKRQDGLLHKCKETITTYKEKVTQLSHDKQELLGKLELTSSKSGSAQNSDQIAKLQNQIQEAKKVIEQLESDREVVIASVKQQVHGEMEKRDAELEQMKLQNQKLQLENNNIKIELEKLENQVDVLTKTNKEQLDKAREIMKKLKDDKLHAVEQAEERIRLAEQNMEEEKEKMLTDLKRGKAEAFSVLQSEL